MMRVKNRHGLLIQKPAIGVFRPWLQRVYNGKETDKGIVPVDKEWEVPRDQYHGRLVAKGDLILVEAKKPAPKKNTIKDKD